MNANEIADELMSSLTMEYDCDKYMEQAATMLRQQQAEIEALKKEAALQRLSNFTQEAESFDRTASHMAGEYVSYKPELTDEDRSMLIRTLKWSEDLLRVAGHDEAVNDVQDCLMIIRKAQEK